MTGRFSSQRASNAVKVSILWRHEDSWLQYTDGLAQDCSISIANALDILQSCTTPSIHVFVFCIPQLRTPWWSLATSLPVYAITVGMLTTDWGYTVYLSYIPTYLHEVLHMNLDKVGRLRRNRSHFADAIFKLFFLYEKHCILIIMSLKFVYRCLIDSKSVLVQVKAWCRTNDKPW